MRNLRLLIVCLMGCLTAEAQGLKPLQPSQFSSRSLHSGPNDETPILREIGLEDKITILRSEGEWYELDVETPEKLSFRGWLKGALALERQPPPPFQEVVQKKEDTKPLASDTYLWFWDRRTENSASVGLHIGGQGIGYKLSGLQSGSVSEVYNYNFSGITFGLSADLPIVRFPIWDRTMVWTLEGSYFYGLYSLSFGSDFQAPELQGVGYRIDTHTYRIQSLSKLEFYRNQTTSLAAGLGLGFYSHEVAPDLQPIRSGTYTGDLVFVETRFQGLSIPILIEIQWLEDWFSSLGVSPLLFSSVSETGSQSADYDSSGFPLLLSAMLGYQWTQNFSMVGEFEQLMASAKATTDNIRRLDRNYRNPEVDLSYLRGTLGFRFHF